MKHTLLGAGGAIGISYAHELINKKEKVRLVSRSGAGMEGAETVKADLSNFQQTAEAVKGSDIVYLFAGLLYDKKVWAELWPKIMAVCTEACKQEEARFVFFDNVYMYGKVDGKMTEETPYNPWSKKGEVRAGIAKSLEGEFKAGNLQVIIARAADLYGPYITTNSAPYIMIFDKLMNGKTAQCLGSDKTIHSYTLTTDCAKGIDLLVNDDKAWNQIWHLPTDNPPPTCKEFVSWVADEIGTKPKYSVLKPWMVKMGGLVDKTIAEVGEMLYQNTYDYYFDSTKFNDHFNFKPTPYREGIRETIQYIRTLK